MPVIGSGSEYQQVLKEAAEASQKPLEKMARDEALTPDDRTQLSTAASLFEGIVAYQPQGFAPYLALGMIYRGLNDSERAERSLRQALNNLPGNPSPEIKQTVAEVHYQLSRVLFDKKDYDGAIAEASTAEQSNPENADYPTAKAAALLQANRVSDAKKALEAALKLDPQNKRAQTLMKLVTKAASASSQPKAEDKSKP